MTAAAFLSERIKPAVKWVGGKSRLLPELIKRLPDNHKELRYIEPFAGGAALFLALQPKRAVLGDANAVLIGTFKALRDSLDKVLLELEALEQAHSRDTFLRTREILHNPDLPEAARAAAFLYLNKTGFNGLYRVNKSGTFNVPFGRYKNPKIRDVETLEAISSALRRVRLVAADFTKTLKGVGYGDFVYLDPPYVAISDTSNFTSYTPGGFGPGDQTRLADTIRDIAHRGAFVMLSQADHPSMRRLYRGFHIQKVENSRSVAANGGSRGRVSELIIRNYR